MRHLGHPFDDAFFAALATRAGYRREELPDEYDPGHDWGNDSLVTELPGMPGFSFMSGDDGWFGRIAVHLPEFTYRRISTTFAEVEIPFALPETTCAALHGATLSRIVEAPVISGWTVARAGRDPADPDGSVVDLVVPPADAGTLCQAA